MRLALQACPDWSDRKISSHVVVDHKFVTNVRTELAVESMGTVPIDFSDSPKRADDSEREGDHEECDSSGYQGGNHRGRKREKVDHARDAARLLLADARTSHLD